MRHNIGACLGGMVFSFVCGVAFNCVGQNAGVPQPAVDDRRLVSTRTVSQAIDQISDFNWVDVSLNDLAEILRSTHALPTYLDQVALDVAGIDKEATFSFQARGMSLRNALCLILRDFDLVAVPQADYLWLTTSEEAEQLLVTRCWPVGDLVKGQVAQPATDAARAGQPRAGDELIGVLTGSISEHRWADMGGSGTATMVEGTLVVSQSVEVLEQIGRLLDLLRGLPRWDQVPHDTLPEGMPILRDDDRRFAAQLADRLTTAVSCEIEGMPLSEAIDMLRDRFELPLRLDRRGLDEAGIDREAPVSGRFDHVSLGSLLRLMLHPLELDTVVEHQSLTVTTTERAQERLSVRVYPVGGLLPPGARTKGQPAPPDSGDLVFAIRNATVPECWSDTGGDGSIQAFAHRSALIISQSDEGHRSVQTLLNQLYHKDLDRPGSAGSSPGGGRGGASGASPTCD